MHGSSSWIIYAPQGVNGFDDDEARSCNHCCSGKAMNITYSECVCSLRYPACTAHAPYCHLWLVQLCSIISQTALFSGIRY